MTREQKLVEALRAFYYMSDKQTAQEVWDAMSKAKKILDECEQSQPKDGELLPCPFTGTEVALEVIINDRTGVCEWTDYIEIGSYSGATMRFALPMHMRRGYSTSELAEEIEEVTQDAIKAWNRRV